MCKQRVGVPAPPVSECINRTVCAVLMCSKCVNRGLVFPRLQGLVFPRLQLASVLTEQSGSTDVQQVCKQRVGVPAPPVSECINRTVCAVLMCSKCVNRGLVFPRLQLASVLTEQSAQY
ncbi:hypothetical protein J6590_067234 [Homalodisca vitripennis]|nr:hypothetical protein J6590_067234 [Homalodisca vitripennis]